MAKKATTKRSGKPKPAQKAVEVKKVAEAKKPVGPTARTCPLVLDGEVDAGDFSLNDCLTCEEFDCRFCEAAQGSGALRSRLFVSDDGDSDDGDDGWGGTSERDDDVADEGGADEEGDDLL